MMKYPTWLREPGVYRIWLSPTHFYIGRSSDCRVRWLRHLAALRQGKHPNPHMQRVYDIHGVFNPEVISKVVEEGGLPALEQEWLDAHYGEPGCVNNSHLATGTARGFRWSGKARAKPRPPTSAVTRRRLSEALTGHDVSDVTRQKLSTALLGKKRPDNAERNMARTGWTHTEPARTKITEAGRRRVVTGATRLKMSATKKKLGTGPSFKGQKHSPETIRKIVLAKTGGHDSEATRTKKSDAAKVAWARRKVTKKEGPC
jgi:hypothetical protein